MFFLQDLSAAYRDAARRTHPDIYTHIYIYI